jgi:hypothetical protein
VEYYHAGTNRNNFMDWQGLWLIWQPSGSKWFLSGIAHDQWTI